MLLAEQPASHRERTVVKRLRPAQLALYAQYFRQVGNAVGDL